MVVPGSQLVKTQAEREGLDHIFIERWIRVARAGLLDVPGHESRHSLARRTLRLHQQPQLRGPPGRGGRTHLVSPQMAAAAAVTGHFVDVREWEYKDEPEFDQ